jgi:hypothetical protein
MAIAAAPVRALDTGRVIADVRARLLGDVPPTPLVERYLDTLTPERWTIEWHLPWWLASRFALPDDLAAELVASNVLGLLSVRVADDVADGDLPPEDVAEAREIAAAAMDVALVPYRRLFGCASAFWPFLHQSMAAWRAGASGAVHALRAAPIKVGAFGCCLLAHRTEVWPALDRCLDRAMTALVLYDQFVDWEPDVDAGRWNAFVDATLERRTTARTPHPVRSAVLAEMLTGDVVAAHFDRIAAEADAAIELADGLGIEPMAAFLRSWAGASRRQGEEIALHYRRVADQATRLLFPDAVGMDIGGGPG